MPNATLLPPNASPQERAIEEAVARISAVPTPMRALWNADTCPGQMLPWLAWAMGVDVWDSQWSDGSKRETIKTALQVKQRKGTIWSIKRVLASAGYGDAEIIEGNPNKKHDGSITRDGKWRRGDSLEWAQYAVKLTRPITTAQAQQVRKLLGVTAPARCHLIGLDYTAVANLHDGKIYRDGTYSRGQV